MRDLLNDFGTAAQASAMTLSNVLDFGPIDPRARMQSHRTGAQHDSTVVAQIDLAVAAAVTGIKLQDSDDNSAFADLLALPDIPAAAPAGTRAAAKFPLKHKRYVRLVAASTAPGAGTVPNLSAWLEPGPAL
jgi:hypothetical protein